jgi:3',5'-nucleoside bisphosphate phosphatase
MRMLERYAMDLHIHTCLSPCGESSSVPTKIVDAAVKKGMRAVAICDHNAAENVAAVRDAAKGSGLKVLGGMEITTKSEIHVLGIFDDDTSLGKMQELVYENLAGTNDSNAFGPQYIVDEEDYITGYNEHLLVGASELEIEAVVSAIHEFGGMAVASHVDRGMFSILSQLGFIPESLELDALELSKNYRNSPFSLTGLRYPFVRFSDAHRPEDIGSAFTEFLLEGPTVEELKIAAANKMGRKVLTEIKV